MTTPGLGRDCSVVHRANVGDALAYYDQPAGALVFADPEIEPKHWKLRTLDHHVDVGRQVALSTTSAQTLAYSYYGYDRLVGWQLRAGEYMPDSARVLSTVTDTLATGANDEVLPDLFVTPDHIWYVSYRNTIDGNLYFAYNDSFQIGFSDIASDSTQVDSDTTGRLPGSLSAFPNPSYGMPIATYHTPTPMDVQSRLVDSSGRTVWKHEVRSISGLNETPIHLPQSENNRLPAGVYFLSARAGRVDMGSRRLVIVN